MVFYYPVPSIMGGKICAPLVHSKYIMGSKIMQKN